VVAETQETDKETIQETAALAALVFLEEAVAEEIALLRVVLVFLVAVEAAAVVVVLAEMLLVLAVRDILKYGSLTNESRKYCK
jgi:hypothetical protein